MLTFFVRGGRARVCVCEDAVLRKPTTTGTTLTFAPLFCCQEATLSLLEYSSSSASHKKRRAENEMIGERMCTNRPRDGQFCPPACRSSPKIWGGTLGPRANSSKNWLVPRE